MSSFFTENLTAVLRSTCRCGFLESMVTVPSGVSTVKVSVGSSYPDSYIYAGISDSRRSIRGEWIKVSDGMASIKIDAPADDERVFISLLGMRELRGVSGLVTVVPAVQQEQSGDCRGIVPRQNRSDGT